VAGRGRQGNGGERGNRGNPGGGGSYGGNSGGYGGGYSDGPPPPRRRAPPPRTPAKRRRPGRGFWGTLAYWGAVCVLWAGVAGVGVFIWVASDLPDPEELWRKTDRPSITFVDIRGEVVDRRGAPDAPPVDLKSLPAYVPQAVLAIEDRKFYRHWGVDFEGLARAFYVNMRAGRVVQGGSTLTQQLAKNLFLSSDQNLKRKAQELLLSVWLESRFTKEEILSLYLARVYFGAGAYGIDEASRRYFDKPPQNLTIAESALLAGLLKAPSRFNPVSSAKRAAERATVVLDVMESQKVITAAQRLEAVRTPLRFVPTSRGGAAGYFLDWIEDDVGAIVGEPTEDVIVETTLDLRAQNAAETAITNELNTNARALKMSQAALVAFSADGGVRAMVGGRSYGDSEFNRITEAKRQPGSAFKPFVYLAAMERGETPWSTRVDRPLKLGNWTPQNYDGGYRGTMPLITAFAKSTNTIAVQLGEEAGRDAVVRVARRLGVRSRLDPQPTLALGTEVLTPLELTAAYVPFANGGNAVIPHGFKRVRTRSGKILWERPTPAPRRAIEDRALRNMNLMLAQVVSAGTARGAQLPDRPVGGKTGTTSDYRDAWFIGFTGGYAAGVWVGNDDFGIRTNKVTGGSAPARIWKSFMVDALKGTPSRAFALPTTEDQTPVPAPMPMAQNGAGPVPIEMPGVITTVEAPPVTEPALPAGEGAPVLPNTEAQPPTAAPLPQAETRTLDQIVRDAQAQTPRTEPSGPPT
jgi:penicillin-binding protein 1A